MSAGFNWPKPWILVLLGLVLNVLAMVISSTKLDSLNTEIARINEQKQDNTYSIQLAWSSIDTLERKKEALVLLVSGESGWSVNGAALMLQQLANWVVEPPEQLTQDNVTQWFTQIEQTQGFHRGKIDELYLNNLSLSESAMDREKQANAFKSLALFLQVFGLALILARDLARR